MSRVLVIGASGFLGSHIADVLTEQGHEVTLFDRSPSPWRQNGQTEIVGDIMDREALSRAMTHMDAVYHLAGIAAIDESAAKPHETIRINVLGSSNIFETCIAQKVRRVIFASTVYVYGDKGSFYRVSKQATENMLEEYARSFDLRYTILRYGSLYGPRSQSWNSLRRYVKSALDTGRIIYHGTGEERREFIHVRDAASLSVKALNEEYINKSLMLTGTQVLNYQELLLLIKEVFGNKIDIEIDQNNISRHHYKLTPFTHSQRTTLKVVSETFVDIGQGLVELVNDVSEHKS